MGLKLYLCLFEENKKSQFVTLVVALHIFKQHAMVFGLTRVKFHRYGVPNALLWGILEAMTTKDEDLAALRVSPLRYYNPPTTYARCLYLDL